MRCLFLLFCLMGPGLVSSQTLRYNLAEKHWLDQHQTLRIGVVEQTPPILFYAGGNNPQGLVADYLRAVAMHLGLQLEITRYPDWLQLTAALRDGEVDALGGWPVGFDHTKSVLPSRPYLYLPVALYGVSEIPSAGLPGLRGKTLAVLKGSIWEQLAQIAPDMTVTPYSTLEQALQAAANGHVYAYLGDAASADYLLKRQSIGDVEQQMQLDLTYDWALASRIGSPELVSLLQKGLDRIGPDELHEIWHRWPGVERPQPFSLGISSMLLWIPLVLVWSALLVWGVNRYFARKESMHHIKLKQAIRRLQRREKQLKEKLLSLKQKTLDYRGESQQHRERLRLMEDVLPSAAWVWEPSTTQCQWDEHMYTLFQVDSDQFEPTPDAILERVHEEDRAQVATLFHQPEGETESRLTYRVLLPDGAIRRLLDFSYYSIDQTGGGAQRIGLCWDITDYLCSTEGSGDVSAFG